jgi:hypothetical protein
VSKSILAIGGPKHLEMLPYDWLRQEYVVAIPETIKFNPYPEVPTVREIKTFVYYVQRLGNDEFQKLVYVGEDIRSVNKATEILKEALLELWVSQPYKDDEPEDDPPF